MSAKSRKTTEFGQVGGDETEFPGGGKAEPTRIAQFRKAPQDYRQGMSRLALQFFHLIRIGAWRRVF